MIVADTSALFALFDGGQRAHGPVRRVVHERAEPLVVSPYVIAELDYLVATRRGVEAELAVLRELSGGAYVLPAMTVGDLLEAADVVDRFADQQIGVADASLLVLAERYATRAVLTLDRRHFDVLRFEDGSAPEVLP